MNRRCGIQGYTLIEALVALAVGLFIVLVAISALMGVSRVGYLQVSNDRIHEAVNASMQVLRERFSRVGHPTCMSATDDSGLARGVARTFELSVTFDAGDAPFYLDDAGIAAAERPYRVRADQLFGVQSCDASGCASLGANFDAILEEALPPHGDEAGSRVRNSDALVVRPRPLSGTPVQEIRYAGQDGLAAEIGPGMPSAESFGGHLLLAGCSGSAAVSVGEGSEPGWLRLDSRNFSPDLLEAVAANELHAFALDQFSPEIFYLQWVAEGEGEGRIPTLMRWRSGQRHAVAPGVERMDFLLHLADSDSRIAVLDPAEVPAWEELHRCRPSMHADQWLGCAWSSIRGLEAHLLVVGDFAQTDEPLSYAYPWDAAGQRQSEAVTQVPPASWPLANAARLHFTTYIGARSYLK